jgi:hypothetical protein
MFSSIPIEMERGCWISQHACKRWKEEEEHENNVVPINQKINITSMKRHEAWGSWNQKEEEHEKYVVPRNQETNIMRVKRQEDYISLKSHKPWKTQILMKLKKLGTPWSLEVD